MRVKKLLVPALFALGLMISCSKDDGPSTPPNSAPVITNATKAFTVAENINDAHVIGTVTATDADKDALTFSISANSDNLFEIANSGAISLATGKTLSFATKSSHALEITVSDGTASAKANFTITVTQVVANNETPVIGAQSFEVAENIDDTFLIGTVQASDAENDPLAFAMVTNDNDLFEITTSGELSLADGKSLDFATAEEHTLTVGVSDGNTQAQATITVTVTQVVANGAPTMGDQSFEAAETIADDVVIGTVTASDPENDALTFAITTNDNDLFEITADGALSLADGQNLDEETAAQHTITVSVDDGNGNVVEAEITITVLDRYESKAEDPEWFVTTWEPMNDEGDNLVLQFAVDPETYTYNFVVDWGDGTIEENPEFKPGQSAPPFFDHIYENIETFTVAIKGELPYFSMDFGYLVTIEQWGAIQWKSMEATFSYQDSFEITATDVPDLSQTTSMSYMFQESTFSGDVTGWDTSNVTDMSYMFDSSTVYNVDISGWDTSNVTDMSYMFNYSTNFNGVISNWNTSSVTNMEAMFRHASSFNGDISAKNNAWNTGNVTNMRLMFNGADDFNQNISGWDTGNVTDMSSMFSGASSFNQNLGAWDLSSVTNMSGMFDSSGLSSVRYGNTLIGWATFVQSNGFPNEIIFTASNVEYCDIAQVQGARNYLINTAGWGIDDGGPTNICN
ncbi:BspA family leucine-rich repeat surface protein [Flagellimonas marina]|uniref:BspA family leucine-rich repeat surface protein n=1 Tax=Flagellimonas marina TaxID=1775168 RepID=A0ABV8PL60_9FLAO